MKNNDQLNDLAHIRGLMDRSTRFLSLSGLSGVFAGVVALGGAAMARFHINEAMGSSNDMLTYGATGFYEQNPSLLITLMSDALLVLFIALIGAAWFTWRRAKKTGHFIWDTTARRLMWNMVVPLVSGGLFCLALFSYGLPGLVPPATLIFYGLALFNASKYTLNEVRWLGLSELVLGIVALFWLEAGLLFWAMGFGILHIFYGALMYVRYERVDTLEQA